MTDTPIHHPPTESYTLADRYRRERGEVFLTGIQALARIPVEQLRRDRAAGLNTAAFLSGYPGSPLGGFDLEIARVRKLVPDLPIVHQPAVNEELGATSVMGSQLAQGRPDATRDGVVGFWYGKAPGLDRAGDALRHGVFAGSSSNGGAVVLVGDDPACKSSTMPSSSDASLVDLHMPILYPGTMSECIELGLHAVAMSRASGLWSSMKIVTPVADGSGTVTLPVLDTDPIIPTIEIDGERWVSHPTAKFLGRRMLDVEREFREVRLPLAQRYGVDNGLNRISIDPPDAWIGLVATGFTYHEMLDALRRLGLDGPEQLAAAGVRVLQLRMPVPFDADLVRTFARGLDEIVVVEEKNPTLEWLIKDALYGRGPQPLVVGKTHEDGRTLMQSWGRLDADAMMPGLRERLAPRLADRLAPPPQPARERALIPLAVNRTPFFCSGCPHNWGTKVPDGALVGAGTGCHGMSLLMDEDRVGETIGITAMGNEGAQWVGMAPFVETDHIFQNYGDGTFFHSAQLALQYCIGAGMNITFKILYNGTVAMTGGQDSTSPIAVPELVTILLAHGVSKVAVTADDTARYDDITLPRGVEVHDRTDIVAVQAELAATPGVTVLIHDQFCAAELRRDRKRGRLEMPTRRVVINHRICEGCGDCGDVSNCLSVQPIDTPLGRKTTIDQASCNFDESCLQGDCPAFMTVEVGPGPDAPGHSTPAGDVPDPEFDTETDLVRIRLAGIGGTGVVTVAQVLSTAAMFDGWEVRGLDQTGLSQKAGPVISDVVLAHDHHGSSNLVGDGQAELILAFDAMVAADDGALAAADPDRTVVIASTAETPTGRMISHPDIPYPIESITDRLTASTRSHQLLDATRLSAALTGNEAQANVLLLGVAVQLGHVPVSVTSIETAIELNGVAVDANLAAFDWGRRWAHDHTAVESLVPRHTGHTTTITVPDLPDRLGARMAAITPAGAFRDLVTMLAADLVAYQDEAYADRFLDAVTAAAEHERAAVPNSSRLTEAVARSLHKLMAYKDEYEVARLMLLPEGEEAAQAVGGPGAAVTWRLHPPMLKAFGMESKLSIGTWAKPVFGALRRGKRLRSTRLDPFGRTEMRRTEAALPDEYLATMSVVYASLTPDRLDRAVDIAGLPDMIRGYEDLKLRRVAEYRSAVEAALTEYRA
ncbi:MAG: indolepyruvate ferredoxin oxidoreductase family protein [Ilumatobacteraceae bacterium]|nr:indolepyruvate ferredoxin oxidoreductase family protein [Ilumatobacteraceae bacterium]